MKKVIKYRVFDISIGWVTNAVMLSSNGECYFKNNLTKDIGDCYIEFFTGVLDKNGKEIYSGDIIRDSSSVYQVLFGQYQDGLSQQVGIGFYLEQTNGFFQPLCQNNKFTILGNIHENSELLKQ